MDQIIPMPKLGMTMTEGILVAWKVVEGAEVAKDDILAEVETDKVTLEIEAPFAGRVTQLIVKAGDTVPVGEPILSIASTRALPFGGGMAPHAAGGMVPPELPATATVALPVVQTHVPYQSAKIPATPLARKIAREHGIDLAAIPHNGQPIRAAAVRAAIQTTPRQQEPATGATGIAIPSLAAPLTTPASEQLADLSTMRRVIAERTTHSFTTTPHIYLDVEVDMWRVERLRRDLGNVLNPAPSVTVILIRAVALALRQHPAINSAYIPAHDGQPAKIRRSPGIHIALATAVPDGLVTPVLRDVDRKSFAVIADEMAALIGRARSGKLGPDDFQGGTFSISNMGMFGIDTFHAIISEAQGAILAVGRITARPAAVPDGAGGMTVGIRPILKLSLSADHRVIDGATGAQYLATLRALLEDPDAMAKEP